MSNNSIEIRPRDINLFVDLLESRVMTSAHVAALHFAGRNEMAKKRLQKLKSAGYIAERTRRVSERSVLFLTRKTFDLLHNEGMLTGYPITGRAQLFKRIYVSDLTLKHELEVMDVKAALISTISKAEDLSVAEFSVWPAHHEFEIEPSFQYPRNRNVNLKKKPDAFIRIHEKEDDGGLSEHAFFLEVDRSNESQTLLEMKAIAYLEYYRNGGFAKQLGHPRSAFKEFPFRVLFVLQNAERRNNTAEKLLQSSVPIRQQIWLTTLPEIKSNPMGSIWMRPVDYLSATKGTPFDIERRREFRRYRRDIQREELVEQMVNKHRLLASD